MGGMLSLPESRTRLWAFASDMASTTNVTCARSGAMAERSCRNVTYEKAASKVIIISALARRWVSGWMHAVPRTGRSRHR